MKSPHFLLILLFLSLVNCNPAKKASNTIPDITIVPRSGWNAADPKPYKQHVPVKITIHHEGTRLEITDDAAKKMKNSQQDAKAEAETAQDHAEGKPSSETLNKAKEKVKDALD